jgi:5-methylcytosine-specific restriction protein A
MPFKALRPCTHPACSRLVTSGKCEEHRQKEAQHYDAARGSARERGYGGTWQKIRAMKLSCDPLCERCLLAGHDVVAVLVHHRDRNPKNNEAGNLESLCDPCHKTEHQSERWNGKEKLNDIKGEGRVYSLERFAQGPGV